MANRQNNINDKIAYFYTVIKNMDIKDGVKQSKINNHEVSVDEVLYDNFLDNFDVDKQLAEQSLLGWIELIENPNLHNAVKSLLIEDQIFISYIVKECCTQRELAQIYKIDHRTVGRRFEKIIKKLKHILCK